MAIIYKKPGLAERLLQAFVRLHDGQRSVRANGNPAASGQSRVTLSARQIVRTHCLTFCLGLPAAHLLGNSRNQFSRIDRLGQHSGKPGIQNTLHVFFQHVTRYRNSRYPRPQRDKKQ